MIGVASETRAKNSCAAMYLGAHTQSIQQPLGQAGRAEHTIIRHTKRNLQPVPKGDFQFATSHKPQPGLCSSDGRLCSTSGAV